MPFGLPKGFLLFSFKAVGVRGTTMTKDKILIIGSGKVGNTFATALQTAGYEVKSIKGHQEFEAGKPEELTRVADIILITTPDSKIMDVTNYIASKKGFHNGQTVIHMSGAYTSDLLLEAKNLGAVICSLHPLQSFADPSTTLGTLPDTVFSIEGEEGALCVAKRMISDLGARVFEIKKEIKPIYHAAACIAANYLVTIMKSSTDLLVAAGIPRSHSWDAIAPLVKGAVNNIETLGVSAALTGPISRGDVNTVNHHLESMYQQKGELIDLYCCLGKYTVDVALENGDLTEEIANEIKQILGGAQTWLKRR